MLADPAETSSAWASETATSAGALNAGGAAGGGDDEGEGEGVALQDCQSSLTRTSSHPEPS